MKQILLICLSIFFTSNFVYSKRCSWIYYPELYYDSLEIEKYIDFGPKQNVGVEVNSLNLKYKLFSNILSPTYKTGLPNFRIWIYSFSPDTRIIDLTILNDRYQVTEYYTYTSLRDMPLSEQADSVQIFYSSIGISEINQLFNKFLFSLSKVKISSKKSNGPFFRVEYNQANTNFLLYYMYSKNHIEMVPILEEFFRIFPHRLLKINIKPIDYLRYFG